MYGLSDRLKPLSAAEEQVLLALWDCPAPATRRDISEKLTATGWADYLVTGNFSNLAAKEAAKFGEVKIVASSKDRNFTYIPDVNAIDYDKDASYIHICQNNTIFGTQYVEVPQVEGVPLVADMSSMILSKPVDVNKYGCIYFGVQKNVAPAGMAIAIVRDDLLGHAADTVPTMMNYTTLLAKDSMYNTPPFRLTKPASAASAQNFLSMSGSGLVKVTLIVLR